VTKRTARRNVTANVPIAKKVTRNVSGSVAKPRKDIASENDAPFFFFQRSLRNNMVLRTLFF